MSRKRTMSFNDCNENCNEYEYQYYSPGCYYTPQMIQNNADECAYLRDYLPQWDIYQWNPATYVVDTYGVVYYCSDFEYQLQLPRTLAVETEISYHYIDNDLTDIKEEDDIIPRKKERFEHDIDVDENDQQQKEGPEIEEVKDQKDTNKLNCSDTQAYIVEEPEECETVKKD